MEIHTEFCKLSNLQLKKYGYPNFPLDTANLFFGIRHNLKRDMLISRLPQYCYIKENMHLTGSNDCSELTSVERDHIGSRS